MKTTKKTDKIKAETWKQAIASFTKFAAENRGAVTRLAERMGPRFPALKNLRVHIDGWTTANDERRHEPRYSVGKVLLEEAKIVMETMERKPEEA